MLNFFREAKLSAAQRKKLPKSSFGVPSRAKTASGKAKSGSFPINDKAHAVSALRFIRHAPPGDRARIRAKAAKFGVGPNAKKSTSKKGSSKGRGKK